MTPTEALLSKLTGAKKTTSGWCARCPAHEDRKPSLSVSEGEDGRALIHCHAGCAPEAVCAAVGLSLRDLMPERNDPQLVFRSGGQTEPQEGRFATANDAVLELERRHGKRAALWTYTDAAGNPVGLVIRWDRANGSKDIRPTARHGNDWRIGAIPDPRPLYGLPDLAAAKRVLVVEGEKCADAARALGFIATTSAGGSQAAGKTDWSPLARKEVWLLPDNDAPGRKYADTVAGILAKLSPPPVVKVVELPDLPDKGDIADWIEARGDGAKPDTMRAEVEALAAAVDVEPPDPPKDDCHHFRPFPVNVLPEPIRGFVADGAKAIGCDPSYLALPLLVALAAAIGNTRRLLLKPGWSVPPILWGAIVGDSGTAKTPAFKLVMRPARERQRRALDRHAEVMKEYEANLARWEKDFAAWKRAKGAADDPPAKPDVPDAVRYIVSDTTVEALAPIMMANP
ncbi:MAG: DUF3987 domain-containing protein, partial [Planctomycetes bacterium]|nr:DUF3987 domain-containing protein [Planctomycetota bacterium]